MAAPRYMNGVADSSKEDLKRLEGLSGLPTELDISDNHKTTLKAAVNTALSSAASDLAKVQIIVANAGTDLEQIDPDPAQARLNLQLALNRLVSDEATQKMARKYGKQFQVLYNLTNDQMLTLCRLAVDVGAYKDTKDLNDYMDAFSNLPPEIKGLSPGALEKLGLAQPGLDGLIGSCSCCCP